ncbi:MAG: mevalonate kinase [Candidatus Hermodarchaeota archaeon]
MKIISASAPGKVILLGEHAVVYGFPAIAMAITLRSTCTIESVNQGIRLILKDYNSDFNYRDLNQLKKEIPFNFRQISLILDIIRNNYNIDSLNIKITLGSQILSGSGLGSSASVAAALITALNTFYDLKLEKSGISNLAYKMEQITHGTPSGIDNTVCTHGNLIFFKEGLFHFVNVFTDFSLLITYSNIEHNTKQAILNIKKFKEEQPSLTNKIFKKIGFYTEIGRKKLINGNLKGLGKIMNQNQNLLERLHLSNDSISEIISIGLNNGAYGSKITGAGLGGCVITLASDKVLEQILILLQKKGYKSFIVKLDSGGAMIEK